MGEKIHKGWFFALLSFLILITASSPFIAVYNLGNQFFLSVMLGLICLITLCFNHFLITVPLYFLIYTFTLYVYFPLNHLFGISWVSAFYDSLIQSYNQVISGEVSYLPNTIALVIILFFLVALAILLIQYERIWLSYLMIVGYHFMLVIFNRLQLGWPLIVITCLSVLLYQLKRYPETGKVMEKRKAGIFSLLLLAFIAGSSHYFQQSFPAIQTALYTKTSSVRNFFNSQGIYNQVSQYGIQSNTRTGFSDNDQQLGGPIMDDPTVLFTALQTKAHYWRVETKDSYTGKGWEAASAPPQTTGNPGTLILSDSDYQGTLATETMIALTFSDPPPQYLPQPYGKFEVNLDRVTQMEYIEENNRVNLSQMPIELDIIWQEPNYPAADLQLVSNAIPEALAEQLESGSVINGTFNEAMDLPPVTSIELPDSVPVRVQELALELTEQENGLYNKVKAIEHYLKTDRSFRYSKTDTPFTPNNQDYVDHFLFDSKVGYCDNFSTSMVVLLRSIGIPSRWAKGFNSGELIENQGELKEYSVRNSHAHSWPEVYFEGYGWIPFEPTPSFSNPDVPVEEADESSESNQDSSTVESSSTEAQRIENSTAASSEEEDPQTEEITSLLPSAVLKWFAAGAVLAIASSVWFLLYYYFFLIKFKVYQFIRPANFAGMYQLILKQAEKTESRGSTEPLNQYAVRFEENYPEFEGVFISLTQLYEQAIYGGIEPNRKTSEHLLIQAITIFTKFNKKRQR
ncbi:DUF3488 and transglutaminase-like domain-containing protein [Enterococcus sp. BWT-B8]|uniref:transglutaminase family protein n=1 Tax=Enterococcus sp. BWT-B8 TaxID=2885157 RepID=UPI001E498648|nr:transglutaminase domain-containing protein [Enterococcus sp. BWT-B8]MCB5952456.1 DUF3488 and transglutaminase-like domain-containing protein [Enterococcus sp. BWT-B8]